MTNRGDERPVSAWRRPFPFWRGLAVESRHTLTVAGLAGVLIWMTRPFGLGALERGLADTLILQLVALSAVVDLLLRTALPWAIERSLEMRGWTVSAEIARVSVELLILASALLAFLHLRLGLRWSLREWGAFVLVTALCALAPVSIRVLASERTLRLRHERELRGHMMETESALRVDAAQVAIEAVDGKLVLPARSLRLVRAEENYVAVVWFDDGGRHERLMRSTLSDVERQLTDAQVLRCHRSFLVSLPAIESAHGNAQGYVLRLADVDDVLPVSRRRAAAFLAAWPPAGTSRAD